MAPTDPRVLALHKASWDFAEAWAGEDEPRTKARQRAAEIGCPVVSTGAGSMLRLLAAAIDARNVVEIGTGAGISALWLLDGMNPYGVLTSVDSEAEHQLIAKDAIAESGISPKRVRLINGKASEVLDRLTEYAYDIVLISDKPTDLESNIESAMTLLRQGGLLVIDRALWSNRLADPAQRDSETVAVREAVTAISKNSELVASLIPVGDGLLVAVRS